MVTSFRLLGAKELSIEPQRTPNERALEWVILLWKGIVETVSFIVKAVKLYWRQILTEKSLQVNKYNSPRLSL